MLSDIEIAQQAKMLKITEVAAKLGIPEEDIEMYGRYKAKLSMDLIRRMEAVTPKGEILIFNFFDYKLNPDIPDQRFIYDPPSSANTINNFLFSE